MPLPLPRPTETENEFISRCIPVAMDEFPEEAQATAVCYTQWENRAFKDEKSKFKTLGFDPINGAKQKFYDWDVCISDMKDQGYSDDVAAKICGSIKAGR